MKYVAIYTGDWRHCRLGTEADPLCSLVRLLLYGPGIKKAFAKSDSWSAKGEKTREERPGDRCKIERADGKSNRVRPRLDYTIYITASDIEYQRIRRHCIAFRRTAAAPRT